MSFIKEFKEFSTKGNVMELAVGIIIGSAFGKIVSSLVADIIMPPIGLIVGGTKFTDLKLWLNNAVVDDGTGEVIKEAVALNVGNFIQAIFDFLMIAGAIFCAAAARPLNCPALKHSTYCYVADADCSNTIRLPPH